MNYKHLTKIIAYDSEVLFIPSNTKLHEILRVQVWGFWFATTGWC